MYIPFNNYKTQFISSEIINKKSYSILSLCSSDHSVILKTISFVLSSSTMQKIMNTLIFQISIAHPFILQPQFYSYNSKINTITYPQMITIEEKILDVYLTTQIFGISLQIEVENRKKNNFYFKNYEIYFFIKKSLECFTFLQKNQIIHNNIKLNHFLYNKGEFKLIDFTIAVNLNESDPKIMGNENYISPFMKNYLKKGNNKFNKNLFYKNDLWAFGLILLNLTSLFNINGVNDELIILNERIKDLRKKKFYEDWIIDFIELILEYDEIKCYDFEEINIIFKNKEKNDCFVMKHYIQYLELELEKTYPIKVEESSFKIGIKSISTQSDSFQRKETFENMNQSEPNSSTIRKLSEVNSKSPIKKIMINSLKSNKKIIVSKSKSPPHNTLNDIRAKIKINSPLLPKINKKQKIINEKLDKVIIRLKDENDKVYNNENELIEIIDFIKNQPNDPVKAEALELISSIHQKKNRINESIEFMKLCLEIRLKTPENQLFLLSRSYFSLAYSYFQNCNYESALNNFINALKIKLFKTDLNSNKNILINYWIGFSYLNIHKFDVALDHLTESLSLLNKDYQNNEKLIDITKKNNYNYIFPAIYLALSITHRYKGNFPLSKSCLENGLLYIVSERIEELGIYYFWFGIINNLEKNIEISIENFEQSYKFLMKTSNKNQKQIADLQYWLGINYNEIKQYDKAIDCHQKAYEMRKNIYGEKHDITIDSLFWIAMIKYDFKDYDDSLKILEKIYDVKLNNYEPMHIEFSNLYYWKSQCHFQKGNLELSYKNAKHCEIVLIKNSIRIPTYLDKMITNLKEKLNLI